MYKDRKYLFPTNCKISILVSVKFHFDKYGMTFLCVQLNYFLHLWHILTNISNAIEITRIENGREISKQNQTCAK